MDNTTGLLYYLINNTNFSENATCSESILPDISISQVKQDSSIFGLFIIIAGATILFLCYVYYFARASIICWKGQVPNPYQPGVYGMPEHPFA